MKGPYTFLHETIGFRYALMLAQMLDPGSELKQLEPAARMGDVLEYSPGDRAITSTEPAHGIHGTDELRGA